MSRITVAAFLATVAGQDTFEPCFLYDNYCMENPLRALDKNDPRITPELHPRHCIDRPRVCVNSGFGLNCLDPNATGKFRYKRKYKFDEDGNKATLKWLKVVESIHGDPKNIFITVQGKAGVPNGNATILSNLSNFTFVDGRRSNVCTPCQNRGTLVETLFSCRCQCNSSFSGALCENAPSGVCATGPNSQPCQNGGMAAGTTGSCTCDCLPSFVGKWCENGPSDVCTTGPNSRLCENNGIAAGTTGSCTCNCPPSFVGEWCENSAPCTPSSLDVGEALDCMYTVKAGTLNMHYKDNSEEKTLFLCFENLKDNGYVAAGPGRGMTQGTRAVVSAEGHDQDKVFDITSVGMPTEFFPNFGHSKLRSLVQDGKRINCFQMPYSRLDPDENSISSTNIAWAVGDQTDENFRYHQEKGVFQFNFRSGGAQSLGGVPALILGHVALMMIAFLLLYPTGVLVAVFAGAHFQKGATYFNAHRLLMLLAILVSIAGVALALTSSKVDTLHGGFGLGAMVLCLLQPINAFFRPNKEHRYRLPWEQVHKGLGRMGVGLGLATCVMGAFIFDDRYGYLSVVLPVVLIPLVAVVILWLVFRLKKQPPKEQDQSYLKV